MTDAEFAGVLVVLTFIGVVVAVAVNEIRKTPEQRKREVQENRKRHEAEMRNLEAKRYAAGKVIVEVKLLAGGSTTYKRGGLGGAVLGGMIAGPLGAVVGAATPGGAGEQMQKFAVKYSDGRVVIKECHPNSPEYKELMKYVKWEEI